MPGEKGKRGLSTPHGSYPNVALYSERPGMSAPKASTCSA